MWLRTVLSAWGEGIEDICIEIDVGKLQEMGPTENGIFPFLCLITVVILHYITLFTSFSALTKTSNYLAIVFII